MPTDEEVSEMQWNANVKDILDATIGDETNRERKLHEFAKELIAYGKVNDALKVLLL